jgi:hypothetical protein
MSRLLVAFLFVVAAAPAAPVPKGEPKPSGILVLDNCDKEYKGKDEYADNLTLFGLDGKEAFRLSGFNTCEAISSTHLITSDAARKCLWAGELVAKRIRRFDLTGKETLSIAVAHVSAVAVDPDTGNVWAAVDNGQLGTGKVAVFDPDGKAVATHDVPGWDIVYDRKAKAFWVAGQKLTKLSADTGEVLASVAVCDYSVSSVDADPKNGGVWVAASSYTNKVNRYWLLKFDADGKETHRVTLDQEFFTRISADPADGGVWVARSRRSVRRYTADAKTDTEHEVEALAVETDPDGRGVWVVTPTETQLLTAKGEVKARAAHAGKTTQAWIGVVK